MDNSEVVGVLNDLIETSKDREYAFMTCAKRATSVELKQTFSSRASDCASGARELQALVVQYGGKVEHSGTVSGAVHRGWVSVRDAVSGTSGQALLDECERAEDVALSRYRKALKEDRRFKRHFSRPWDGQTATRRPDRGLEGQEWSVASRQTRPQWSIREVVYGSTLKIRPVRPGP